MAVKKYDRRGREEHGSLREKAWGRGLMFPQRPGLWIALQIWSALVWAVRSLLYGLAALTHSTAGKVVLFVVAGVLLLDAGFGTDSVAVPIIGAFVWPILLVYGAFEFRRRRQWEESIEDTVREVVPGHSTRYPPEVTFGPKLRYPHLYRYTGRYDFRFKVPNVVRRSHLFDLEEHLAEQLRAADNATWFLDWNLRAGSAKATCIPEVPRLITYDELDYALETYPGGEKVGPDAIPLAISTRGIEVWEPEEVPHCLFAGTTGGGKSVAMRTVLAHVLRHPERFVVFGVDPKRVELSMIRGYENVETVATDVEDMAEVIEGAYEEMERRYAEMEAAGEDETKYLEHDPEGKRILVVVDELADITSQSGLKTEEAKYEDELAGRITLALERIAAKGRAAAVHLLLCTQRPDVADSVMSGKMRANVSGRLACGATDVSSSKMILKDSTAAAELEDDEKGRGIWLPDKRPRKVQIILTEKEDLPEKEVTA